ncbi:asparaginase [Bifidobacterium actinocoloniiforme DSM 22766]|uniref:Asparaginase n=1 Tax=Bifidobacterium actinocoloniiforme DSM 22766 TaxID=1437605 RepID=A0A086Z061_9BIFI|nr:N(4)-(beta-N-acetylglucosaminyl)-L-asparaginase [Bifidobacterium actinocoloniiforme]AKV55172.1 N(4)-(beta-N-acetylglucosaminyl)-L-asparaginase [Bifidobacterium actinocoloniiforme DSM 22766]KFI39911.1 asparaginase [Bifidobacterium actinocoloniiforme DSM 22766]
MTWATIATWQMAYGGVGKAAEILRKQGAAADALEELIKTVEADPAYTSVGYGGLPNDQGVVECDAAFMDGDTLAQGAVAGIRGVMHAVSVARALSRQHVNSFLVGEGASNFAREQGLSVPSMLTQQAESTWRERKDQVDRGLITPYDGHDTVGALTLSGSGSMAAATSTSGLFMKRPGRIGDSALSGSGYYVDSEVGGAAATGLGEDIMKGCLSYEIVRQMAEGASPQEACDRAVYPFIAKLRRRYGKAGACSLIALDNRGRWGVASNVEFTFCIASSDHAPQVMLANPAPRGSTLFEPVGDGRD